MNYIKRLSPHSGKLERWLGADKLDYLSGQFRDWYGPLVNIRDVPGSLWITPGGDFVGDFERGSFASAFDALGDHLKQFWKRVERERSFSEYQFGVGFTSISDALARASGGNGQWLNGTIQKSGPTGVAAVTSSLWRVGAMPAAGALRVRQRRAGGR
jgi:hypothetical protein